MDLTSRKTILRLCKEYKFKPARASGQHFLVSRNILNNIVEAAQLKPEDTILEIGAGFGTLTVELLKSGAKVLAVELDKRLAASLKKLPHDKRRLTIIKGDVFKEWPLFSPHLSDLQYKLIANLPYNITSLVLRNFLASPPRPKEMVVLVQKEVAERVVARPGKMSLLSVAVQFYAQPEIIKVVAAKDFWPPPEVDSAILKIKEIGGSTQSYRWKLGKISSKDFFKIVKIGFSARRKQLHNNLANGLQINSNKLKQIISTIGVDTQVRAQDLTIEDWIKIAQNIHSIGNLRKLTFKQ